MPISLYVALSLVLLTSCVSMRNANYISLPYGFEAIKRDGGDNNPISFDNIDIFIETVERRLDLDINIPSHTAGVTETPVYLDPIFVEFDTFAEIYCVSGLCDQSVLSGTALLRINLENYNADLRHLDASEDTGRIRLTGQIIRISNGEFLNSKAIADLYLTIQDEQYHLDDSAQFLISHQKIQSGEIDGLFTVTHDVSQTKLIGNLGHGSD